MRSSLVNRAAVGISTVPFALLLLACGHKNEYEQRREFQLSQAKKYAPAELERNDRTWRAFRTLRVRVYADPTFAKREGNVRRSFEERIARANEVLEPALRIRLALADLRDLPSQPARPDLDAALEAVEQLDSGEDVDVVIGVIGAAPLATLSFHDLGRARVLGRHIVMRSMDDADELRALESFDTLETEERSRLYQQRKRHKEAAVLLHELGHTLGALHVRDRADLMHPHYDNAMRGFAGTNLQLMRLVLSERALPPDQQNFETLVAEIKTRLEQGEIAAFIEEERIEHLAALERALAPAATQATPNPAAAQAPTNTPQAPDLSMLSPTDRELYGEIDALAAQGDRQKSYEGARDLAARYPDSYAVQHKACESAMQLGLPYQQFRPYCDRMAELSMSRANP